MKVVQVPRDERQFWVSLSLRSGLPESDAVGQPRQLIDFQCPLGSPALLLGDPEILGPPWVKDIRDTSTQAPETPSGRGNGLLSGDGLYRRLSGHRGTPRGGLSGLCGSGGRTSGFSDRLSGSSGPRRPCHEFIGSAVDLGHDLGVAGFRIPVRVELLCQSATPDVDLLHRGFRLEAQSTVRVAPVPGSLDVVLDRGDDPGSTDRLGDSSCQGSQQSTERHPHPHRYRQFLAALDQGLFHPTPTSYVASGFKARHASHERAASGSAFSGTQRSATDPWTEFGGDPGGGRTNHASPDASSEFGQSRCSYARDLKREPGDTTGCRHCSHAGPEFRSAILPGDVQGLFVQILAQLARRQSRQERPSGGFLERISPLRTPAWIPMLLVHGHSGFSQGGRPGLLRYDLRLRAGCEHLRLTGRLR